MKNYETYEYNELFCSNLILGIFVLSVKFVVVISQTLVRRLLCKRFHDFGLEFLAEFGVVFEQRFGGVAALSEFGVAV